MRLLHHGRLALLAGLEREAHQDLALAAELLHLGLTEAETVGGMAHGSDIGGAGLGLELHQGAALEVDAEIQADRQEQDHRPDRQQGREREGEAPEAHEVDVRLIGPEAEQAHDRSRSFGNEVDLVVEENPSVPPHVRHSGAPAGRARNPDTQVETSLAIPRVWIPGSASRPRDDGIVFRMDGSLENRIGLLSQTVNARTDFRTAKPWVGRSCTTGRSSYGSASPP